MDHLLRARSVVGDLVGGRDGAAGTFEGVNAAVLDEGFCKGLVLGKLVHQHLLVGLLGGKHI